MENNHQEQNGFSYTYSAKEQAELKRIREKYSLPTQQENKLTRLRRLDASVTRVASAVSLIFGVIGTLILGLGMSLCMTELGTYIGIGTDLVMIIGIIIGVVGGVLACLAYPIYQAMVKHRRKRLGPEIIRLAEELMK